MEFLKDLLRTIIGALMPVIIILVGAGIFGFGLEFQINLLLWVGGVMIIAGLILSFLSYFSNEPLFWNRD